MTDGIRTLVVDDDFRVAALHQGIVAARPGFVALPAARSVGEARPLLRSGGVDLLLVDVHLPDGDGIDLVRSSDVDAIILSAAAEARTVRRALRAGALGYLVKPFAARALEDRLDRFARARNLLAADEARTVDQDVIDRALAVLHGSGEQHSVSRTATEQAVLTAIGDDEASATEVAERVGISRATAQRHLAALAARSVIEVRLRYGATGRPEHRYVRRS